MNLKYKTPTVFHLHDSQTWDYANDGAYFITICTKNMRHHFGTISNGTMIVSEIGQFAERFWIETPDHFPHVVLGSHIIMPNHMHGILIIDNSKKNTLLASNKNTDTYPKNKKIAAISPKSGAAPTINRSYKSAVTRSVRPILKDFAWLPHRYEHIIRDQTAYQRIDSYIINNPKK